MDGWMEMMSSYSRLLSIYAYLKSRMYQNYYDISLLQFLQKHRKFEKSVAAITLYNKKGPITV